MTVKSRATITSEINTNINDNSTGDITPADVRQRLLDLVDSLAILQEDLGLGSTVAAAATLSLGAGQVFVISGNTGITDIDFTTPWDGRYAVLLFTGTPTITHNATTLKLPGGANLTMAAGDRVELVQESGDNINVLSHVRAAGIDAGDVKTGSFLTARMPAQFQQPASSTVNLDTIAAPGFYRYQNGTTTTGMPPVAVAGMLLHMEYDSASQVQIAFDYNSEAMWKRNKVTSTWGPWRSLTGQVASRDVAGTTDTSVLGDMGAWIRSTGASATTFTIPPNSSVAYPVGSTIYYEQGGAGQLSIAAGAGVTLNSDTSKKKIAAQYGTAMARKTATDTWTLSGNLAT